MYGSFLGRNMQWVYGVYVFLIAGVITSVCCGQITLDGTVGTGGAQTLTPDINNKFEITDALGTTVGNNLLHSFGEFNLTKDQIASFSGLANITNIISRVTGGKVSNIDGTIRSTIPGANFFFINPAGVIFGAHAQLDVSGSFVVSTADELRLADGKIFSAVDPTGADNLLLSAPPSAFGFLDGQPLAEVGVQINGATLAVEPGQSITIVADDGVDDGATVAGVVVDGGTLTAASGKVSLASVASAGEVTYDTSTHTVALDAMSFDQLGTVEMINGASVETDADGEVGGTIAIRGGRLTVGGGSSITSNNLSSGDGALVAIDIEVTGQVMMDGVTLQSVTSGGQSGDILIAAGSFEAINNTQIQADTFPGVTSNAANISITADTQIDVLSSSDIFTLTRGDGQAGLVELSAQAVEISGFAVVSANTVGAGSAGVVEITTSSLTMNLGRIDARTTASGSAGMVIIDTEEGVEEGVVDLSNGTRIRADTRGTGSGGTIDITTTNLIMDNSGIQTLAGNFGPAGNITINAETVDLSNTAQITAWTIGPGAGGLIKITADALTLREGDTPSSTSGLTGNILGGRGPFGSAPGGRVELMVNTLDMTAGGRIITDAQGGGVAGNITIDWIDPMSSTAAITMNGASTITAGSQGTGDSGNIVINPLSEGESLMGTVALSENAGIATTSVGQGGDAGDLTINADRITLDGTGVPGDLTALIATSDDDGGNGGLITLNAREVQLSNGGKILNGAFGPGMGGDVMIYADMLTLLSGGQIATSTLADGNSGDIIIYAREVSVSGVGAFNGTDDVGNSNIFSQVQVDATGRSGDIIIEGRMSGEAESVPAEMVRVMDGGNISTTTGGDGTGGDIKIHTEKLEVFGVNATLRQDLIDAGALDATQARGAIIAGSTGGFGNNGDAGNIQINGGTVAVTDGGVIGSSTTSEGAGGVVNINAEALAITTDGFVSSESSTKSGLAGDITIDVGQNIEILSGGSVRTSSEFGSGANMELTAGVDLVLDNGTISSAAGIDGGNIMLAATTNDIQITSGTVTAQAGNQGGVVEVTAGNKINVVDSTINVKAAIDGGNIKLTAPIWVKVVRSTLTGESGQDGGKIDIDPIFVILNQSLINGLAGGEPVFVTIDPNAILLISESQILTTSVSLPPELDLSGSLVNLPENLVDDVAQLSEVCAIKLEGEFSSFIIVGRGGVPVEPGRGLPSFHLHGGAGNQTVTE